MTFDAFLAAARPGIDPAHTSAVLALAGDGLPGPYIARRRSADCGGLSEDDVLAVLDAKDRWDALRERQRFVAEEAARQGRLTPELRATIEATFDRDALDDLYLPFKRKRRTPAAAAAEAGLEPLAEWIWNCGHGLDTPLPGQTLDLWAFTFRSEEHGIADAAQAIAGAEDVLVERLGETVALRARLRELLLRDGWLWVARGERAKPGGRFARYFDERASVAALRTPEGAADYLVVRRGVNEGELRMRLDGGPDAPNLRAAMLDVITAAAVSVPDASGAEVLQRAAARAFEEHLWPAAEGAVQKILRTAADDVALREIAEELRARLAEPPFGARPVLGIDPAPRGGSKVAVVDAAGRPLAQAVVHFDGDEKRQRAGALLAELATQHGVEGVAVGDAALGRDLFRLVRSVLREHGVLAPVVPVTEIGLGAWAAGEGARDELPELDPGTRGAVGIARRLQDPLAELAKVEPRALAAGPWVHDVSQPRLEKVVTGVVTAAILDVGADLSSASDVLLSRLPAVTPGLAHSIVEHRAAQGPFPDRDALRAVPLMDARTFELVEPFVFASPAARSVPDPRGRLEPVVFSAAVRTFADLVPGLACAGVVTNVAAFGAFVDIGLPQDGLVHVSRLADGFVKDPHAVVRPGDRVEVRIVEVSAEKQQIALSMRREAAERAPRPAPRKAEPRPDRERERERERERPARGRPEPAFNNPFAGLASELRGGKSKDPSKGRAS